MNSKRWLSLAVMCCLVVFSTIPLFGQATANASLQGTITDKSQAVIGNKAEITITNKETGATKTTTTNDTGGYRFDSLSAGIYSIKATAPGFSTAEAKDVELLVGRTATQNFSLAPGGVTETVEVTGAAPLVDQTKTDVSTNITPEQITDLPLIGRDIADLAYLAPGVKAADSYDPTKNRYAILSVNGHDGRNINVTVNGVDNKDNTVGGPVMQLPAEAVQEFQVSTQRFSAVNGRSAGAAINVITKSGTNNFHGSAFGFFRDQVFNADQKVPNGDGTTTSSNPPYSRQWFGGSIGGPIKKDKLFAFFAMERQRENTSIAESGQALSELQLVTSLGAQPAAIIPTPFFENRINGRLDYIFNSKHSAYFSVTTQANNSLNDQSNGLFDLTEGNFTKNHLQIANLTLNSSLTPTLINQFTLGFQYWNNLIDSNGRTPLFTFPTGIEFGTNTNVPQNSIQRKYQFKDDIAKTVGKHTFKTGVDYIWTPLMGGFFESNPTLEFDFNQLPSAILALPQGFNTPGLLVGGNANGNGMSISVGDPTFLIKDAKQLGLYFQDDWKMSQRLTVNLGIRYDKDFDFIGGSDIANSRTFQELQSAAAFSPLAASLVAKKAGDYSKGFSPRVGFAYDLNGHGNHIVRAGFGMYYDNTFQNIPLFMEQQANATIFQQAFSLNGAGDIVPGTGIPLSAWHLGDPLPTIPAPQAALLPGSTGRLMDPNYRTPVTEEFNGGYTWAINNKSVFEAEYVHVLSLHENKTINLDANTPIDPSNISLGFFKPLSAAFTAAGVPVLGSVRDEQSIGRSRYDGLNLSYRQRSFHRMDLTANYTLGRAVGYDEGIAAFRNYPRDPHIPLAPIDFGPAANDERHHLTVAATAHLPWGLEASPILQFGSARPYNAIGQKNQIGLGGGSQAQVLLAPGCTEQGYYNGTCGLNPIFNLRGDPYFDMDARLAKNIKLGENRNLQLMFQAFNLTNHANYGNNFDGTVGLPSFGHPLGFINPTSSTLPRAFTGEFGARFSF
ncbi:MAG TPA: TonB-dependent receptor [Candidatus Angelobacter sp.]|nr:TonB-dependent receptor [Candidatus Angelobacter sp.]